MKEPNRRNFLRRIVTLTASAGVAGLLLDRLPGKSVIQPVQAQGTPVYIDTANTGTATTSLSSSGNPALTATNSSNGAAIQGTCTAGTGVWGVAGGTSSGVGVQGTAGAGGTALAGFAGDPGAIPIVAQGDIGQTANLQEWRVSSGALSAVDPSGNFGVGTSSPGGVLDVEGSSASAPSSTSTSIFPSIVSHHGLVNSGSVGIFQQWDVQFQDRSTANRVSAQLLRFTYVRNPGAALPTVYDAMVNLTPLINDNLAGELRGLQVDGPTVASGKTLSTFKAINVSAPSGTVTNNYALITQPGSGNVGIGTNSPSHLIELSGGAYSDGPTWNNASSVRWKENIEPLTAGVETLRQLHPVAYNYKRTPEKRTMGFIAEEIGKILPSVVDWDKTEAGYAQGYDHVAILALAVQALKEQQTQIEGLRSEIKELKQMMNQSASI